MTLRFSDGEEFNLQADPHIEERRDGLYVCGGGHLIPCDTREEAEEVLRDLRKRIEKKGGA